MFSYDISYQITIGGVLMQKYFGDFFSANQISNVHENIIVLVCSIGLTKKFNGWS